MAGLGNYSELLKANPEWASLWSAPAPQPAVTPAPSAPAPVAPVGTTRGAMQSDAMVRDALNQRLAGNDETAQSFIREGDSKAFGAQRAADEQGRSADRAQAFQDDAQERVKHLQANQDRYRAEAERDLKAASEEPKGMAKWGPMLTGIVAAAAAMGGDSGTAQGLGMLGNVIGQGARQKAEAAATRFEGNRKLGDDARQDQTAALDQATKLMSQEHEITARRLDQIASETKVPEYRETALRLAQDTRDKGLALRQNYYATLGEQQRRQAAAAAAAKAKGPDWSKFTDKERNALIASGEAPGSLIEYQQKLDKGGLENEKLRHDGTKGGKLTEGESKQDAVVAGAQSAYGRLAGLVNTGGELNRGAIKETWVPDFLTSEKSLQQRADLDALIGAVLRVESGAAISKDEVANKRAALGLDSGDPQVRANGMRSLLTSYEALDRQGRLGNTAAPADVRGGVGGGLAPAGSAPAPRAPAPAQTVSMVNPDTGEHRMVQAHLVDAYTQHGFVKGRPTDRTATTAPREEYAEATETRRQLPEGGI